MHNAITPTRFGYGCGAGYLYIRAREVSVVWVCVGWMWVEEVILRTLVRYVD